MLKKLLPLAVACLAVPAIAHDHHWDYEHPEKWGDIEVNKLCSAGKTQSPIDINKVVKPASEKTAIKIDEHYKAQDFKISNNGHSIVFDVEGKADSHILVNGNRYDLLQFHYHIPSEHTVMNTYYPLEIHFVHKNADDKLAVVGLLVGSGNHNANLQKLLIDLPKDEKSHTKLTGFDIGALMPSDTTAYTYDGSLTTPPCSEQVQWILKSVPVSADGKQLATLSKLYSGNNRPVQPQGSRQVTISE